MKKGYDKHFNPTLESTSFEERLKNFKEIGAYSKKGIQEREDFYKIYGRAWWWFNGTSRVYRYRNSWSEQFRKGDNNE